MRTPSGAIREVGPHEVLFSATDSRGLIAESNAAFASYTGYPRKRLTGSDHDLLRHPDLPGGIALGIHRSLDEGHTVCCYLDQLSADGDVFRAFTVITPHADGHVTLQVSPTVDEEAARIEGLAEKVAQIEQIFRSAGADDDTVAQAGLAQLEALLADDGHASIASFTRAALPLEMRRRAQARGRRQWPSATDGHQRVLLAEIRWLDALLLRWLPQVDALQGLATTLVGVAHRLGVVANSATVQARAFDDILRRGNPGQQAWAVQQWVGSAAEQETITRRYAERSLELRPPIERAQWSLALAALHSEALAQEAAELAAGEIGPKPSKRAMRLFLRTIDATLADVQHNVAEALACCRDLGDLAGHLTDLTDTRIDLFEGWQRRTQGHDGDVLERLRPEVADALREDRSDRGVHTHIAERCRDAHAVAADETFAQLARVHELVDALP